MKAGPSLAGILATAAFVLPPEEAWFSDAPSWSPDGSMIAYDLEIDSIRQIWVSHRGGGPARPITTAPGGAQHPDWSPDGSRITFHGQLADGNYEVFVMNADGSGLANFKNDPAQDAQPSWSPDGRSIGFWSNRDGSREIHRIDLDGKNRRRLTHF